MESGAADTETVSHPKGHRSSPTAASKSVRADDNTELTKQFCVALSGIQFGNKYEVSVLPKQPCV